MQRVEVKNHVINALLNALSHLNIVLDLVKLAAKEQEVPAFAALQQLAGSIAPFLKDDITHGAHAPRLTVDEHFFIGR
jgi:hypothetical protein